MASFRLALTGDAILERPLMSLTDPVVRPLFDLIRGADAAFTNLEVLPNEFRGDPALESGGSHFGAPARVLDDLVEAGFGLFATAHNHSLDYSISGLRHALAAMEARGLSHAGTGRNLEDARRVTHLTTPTGTIGMVACSATFARGQEASAQRPDMPGRPGVNPLHFERIHEVTAAQMAVLRQIGEQLGLEELRLNNIKMGFGSPPADPAIFPLGGMNFRAAAQPGMRTTPKPADLDDIARWVREARLLSDLVLVSFHAHEQGATKEDPAEFLPAFARRMIDEGADLVVGHGPHLLRGIEIYRGRPIFYSLGNFIGQNELVSRLPSDAYDRFRADASATPGQVYRIRTEEDRKGFPADRRYWESVVPICHFDGRTLTGIDLHPISLGLGEAPHRRGRPRLAAGQEGHAILTRLAALSAPFGTAISVEEHIGTVQPPSPDPDAPGEA